MITNSRGAAAECSHGQRPWLEFRGGFSHGVAKESDAAPRLGSDAPRQRSCFNWSRWERPKLLKINKLTSGNQSALKDLFGPYEGGKQC